MRAKLKDLLDDEIDAVDPNDPADFMYLADMIVGPVGEPGEESFQVIVCPRVARRTGPTDRQDFRRAAPSRGRRRDVRSAEGPRLARYSRGGSRRRDLA